MIFCCSVLYGLLRRLTTPRALELDMTLAAREAALDDTMMDDTNFCVQVSKRKPTPKIKTEQNAPRS